MKLSELKDALNSISGFKGKVAYRAFPENEALNYHSSAIYQEAQTISRLIISHTSKRHLSILNCIPRRKT